MGRYRNVTILAAAIFIQIVGLAVQVKRRTENDSTRLIRVWAVGMVTPFERGVVRVQTSATDVWHNYFYLRGVRQQNRQLQEQIQQLQLEQVRLRQDAEQAHRLQALLGFKEQFIDKTVAAQVIASSGSEQSRSVYLDKGSDDGIRQDMAVISADGIVGKVSDVLDRHTCRVLLINDQSSGVGTILEQSRLQGVVKGKPTGELILDKTMAEEDVKPGDHVLTSGGDQIFPKGLLVGTVAKVARGSEFLQVTVKPAAALNHLEEVLIITKKEEREPAVSTAGAPLRAADILAQRLPTVPDRPPAAAPGATAMNPAGGAKAAINGAAGTAPKAQTNSAVPASAEQAVGRPHAGPLPSPSPGGSAATLQPQAERAGTQASPGTGQTKPPASAPALPTTSYGITSTAPGAQTNPAATQPKAQAPGATRAKAPPPETGGTNAPSPPATASQPKPSKAVAPPVSKPVAGATQVPAQSNNSGETPQ